MATLSINYGTRTEYAVDTNLNSLAANAVKTVGAVANTATSGGFIGYKVDLTVYLASTGVTSNGTVQVYMCESADGTNYTDRINTTATTDQASTIKNAVVIASPAANANSQIVSICLDLPRQFSPKYHSILVGNSTGAAFSSTSNSAYYTPISYTVA